MECYKSRKMQCIIMSQQVKDKGLNKRPPEPCMATLAELFKKNKEEIMQGMIKKRKFTDAYVPALKTGMNPFNTSQTETACNSKVILSRTVGRIEEAANGISFILTCQLCNESSPKTSCSPINAKTIKVKKQAPRTAEIH